jgi:DNA-binding XRE family transcriptional regulator
MEAVVDEMVTVGRVQYDRLREAVDDLADLRTGQRVLADLASGEDEAIPIELVRRMVESESPLRVFRDFRGLSQTELSERSGVNRVQIADIEAGRKVGSVDTVKRLAKALGVQIDDLV